MPVSRQSITTEEFQLISSEEIFYRVTINDSSLYTRPYTGELVLMRMPSGERLFDYACHEGNYSFTGILAGARRQEVDQEFRH